MTRSASKRFRYQPGFTCRKLNDQSLGNSPPTASKLRDVPTGSNKVCQFMCILVIPSSNAPGKRKGLKYPGNELSMGLPKLLLPDIDQ